MSSPPGASTPSAKGHRSRTRSRRDRAGDLARGEAQALERARAARRCRPRARAPPSPGARRSAPSPAGPRPVCAHDPHQQAHELAVPVGLALAGVRGERVAPHRPPPSAGRIGAALDHARPLQGRELDAHAGVVQPERVGDLLGGQRARRGLEGGGHAARRGPRERRRARVARGRQRVERAGRARHYRSAAGATARARAIASPGLRPRPRPASRRPGPRCAGTRAPPRPPARGSPRPPRRPGRASRARRRRRRSTHGRSSVAPISCAGRLSSIPASRGLRAPDGDHGGRPRRRDIAAFLRGHISTI